jgi:AraC family transcriptional regulator
MDAREKSEADRLSTMIVDSLDDEAAGKDLAKRAYWSRTHFHRLFRALVEETPVAMRRRLLLERAAWQLSRTQSSVTEIALDACYGSLEAFTRAFRRAFGVSPSLYRRMGATHFRLPAPSGFHFGASGSRSKGAMEMDLFDRFSGHDSWHTRRLLEHARTLTDEQLDRPLRSTVSLLCWEPPEKNLRELLHGIVRTKEVWTAALAGWEMAFLERAEAGDRTPAGLLARYEQVDSEFNRILREVRDTSAWDDIFVDALCEPPETFTFGGIFAHYITFNTYRRLTAVDALRRLGIDDVGMGCPTEYEAAVAPWRVEEGAAAKRS